MPNEALICVAIGLSAVTPDPGTAVSSVAGGAFVFSTEASPGSFSWGQVFTDQTPPSSFELRLEWEALEGKASSLEVLLPGGILIMKDERIGFWEDNAQFARDGYQEAPALRVAARHAVVVRQDGMDVAVEVDGLPAARHRFAARPAGARLGLGAKSPPWVRARVLVRSLAVCRTDDRTAPASRTPAAAPP